MSSRHLPLAAREIALAPTHPGFATDHGDAALVRPPEHPELFKPEALPDAHHEWAAYVAAGQIGAPEPPVDPAIAANRDRTATLFRRRAADRVRAAHDSAWDLR